MNESKTPKELIRRLLERFSDDLSLETNDMADILYGELAARGWIIDEEDATEG